MSNDVKHGEVLNFGGALELLKEGKKVTRAGWNNPNILVRAQFPDENSMNTEPYLVMEKVVDGGKTKVFPLDLSCESVFAEDWAEILVEAGEEPSASKKHADAPVGEAGDEERAEATEEAKDKAVDETDKVTDDEEDEPEEKEEE